MNTTTPESRDRGFRFAPFAVAALCFLLPFVQVSCAGRTVALSGVQCITGVENTGRTSSQQDQVNEIAVHALFCVAALATVLAAAASLLSGDSGRVLTIVFGLGALGFLVIGKNVFEDMLQKEGGGMATSQWQFGFYLCCITSLVGVLISGFYLILSLQKQPSVQPSG